VRAHGLVGEIPAAAAADHVCWVYEDDEATRRALDEGFTGLRVVAEVSALAASTRHRPDLGAEALADVATGHPLVHAPEAVPPFRVFVEGTTIALAGSIDTFGAGRLSRVLAGSRVQPPTAVLDLTAVEFLDVAACRALARWARDLAARSIALEMRGTSPLTRRVWQVLALSEVAAVTFAGEGA